MRKEYNSSARSLRSIADGFDKTSTARDKVCRGNSFVIEMIFPFDLFLTIFSNETFLFFWFRIFKFLPIAKFQNRRAAHPAPGAMVEGKLSTTLLLPITSSIE